MRISRDDNDLEVVLNLDLQQGSVNTHRDNLIVRGCL